jgi:hypothetical protein
MDLRILMTNAWPEGPTYWRPLLRQLPLAK